MVFIQDLYITLYTAIFIIYGYSLTPTWQQYALFWMLFYFEIECLHIYWIFMTVISDRLNTDLVSVSLLNNQTLISCVKKLVFPIKYFSSQMFKQLSRYSNLHDQVADLNWNISLLLGCFRSTKTRHFLQKETALLHILPKPINKNSQFCWFCLCSKHVTMSPEVTSVSCFLFQVWLHF